MKRFAFFSFFSLMIVSQVIAGGPWPQPMGKGYFKLSQFWVVYDKIYADDGFTMPVTRSGLYNTNFYGEFGVTPRLTALLNANLLTHSFVDENRNDVGDLISAAADATTIGDMNLGAKFAITKPGSVLPVSATVMLGIPSGDDFIREDNAAKFLQTGDGEFNQLFRVDAGYGLSLFNVVSAYASLYAGFNNRTNDFSDEIHAGGEIGAGFLNDRIWFIFRMATVSSLENGDINQEDLNVSLFSNNTEFVSPGFEVSAYITKKLGVSVSYAGASSGRLIAAAPMYSVGVFYDMNR